MTKRMLVDAMHPEETRVAMVDGNLLCDFDFERASKRQLKGNIYLAKVIRIEPSLQAAFVEYGGNRHGFLPFSEIHPDYFRIPMADRSSDEPLPDEDGLEPSALDAQGEGAEDQPHVSAEATDEIESDALRGLSYDAPIMERAVQPVEAEEATGELGALAAEHPLRDFSAQPESEFNLITDFGNAAVPPPVLPVEGMAGESLPTESVEAAATVETVGGEVAEEEQQRRARRVRPPRYKIQEVVQRRQVMLVQVVKEERGNKGAALTTFLSLAGRYCVLMPNTGHGGGVSRKITSFEDRRRMKEILDQLEVPEGMAVILRTAGMEQEPAEIQRDLEYLLRLWNSIREQTLQSTAPALIYEEANLIKRSLRDLYAQDVSEILVAGERAYQLASDFMRAIMPDQADKVKQYIDQTPILLRANVEKQIDQLYNPVVQLRSGGYIVINPTEALVSIDVNSGRATRERHIESTALKTNLEAAEEVARQLRLRDLAGLVVIDFIDMEDGRNNAAVERRLKDSMRADRARLQIGRISPFGLMELSRQRLHPSLVEINFEKCQHCAGMGLVRSEDSTAIAILRALEEEGLRGRGAELSLTAASSVVMYLINNKRASLHELETRYALRVMFASDEHLPQPGFRIDRSRSGQGDDKSRGPAVDADQVFADTSVPAAVSGSLPPLLVAETGGQRESAPQSYDEQQPRESLPPQGQGRSRREDGGRSGFGGRSRRGGRGRNRGGQQQGQNGSPQEGYRQGTSNASDALSIPQETPALDPYDATGAEPGNMIEDVPVPEDNIGNVAMPGEQQQGEWNGPRRDNDQDPNRRGGRRRGRRGGRGRRSGGGFGGGGGGGGSGHGSYPQGGDRFAPRQAQDQHNRNHRENGGSAPSQAGGSYSPPIPVSIHDIDTTPRDERPSAPPARRPLTPPPSAQAATAAPSGIVVTQAASVRNDAPPAASPPPPSPYEVTNQAPDKPKGGWWRKLTGQ
ncbi:MAG: Rne/Rng family ribonuclease [Bdellovibrionales bacterium]